MDTEKLKNPPLVEAIFEMKWRAKPAASLLEPAEVGETVVSPLDAPDASYEILLGQLFARLSKEYPFTERLQTASLPAGLVAFVPQHRFRKQEQGWPLVQVGPGVLTLNDTKGYRWSDFSKRVKELLAAFYGVHPHKAQIVVESVTLRYIDAEPFDYEAQDVLPFLRENLKVDFRLPSSLFDPSQIRSRPEGLNLTVNYRTIRPKGVFQLRVATGARDETKAVVWETVVSSREEDAPQLSTETGAWLDDAHALVHRCFFELIKGELLKRYSENG